MGNPPKLAVRTLTMGIAHGECFGMLGPNGAGKSTTINMLGEDCLILFLTDGFMLNA